MDSRARRSERDVAAEGPTALVRLAREMLRAGQRDEALEALSHVRQPDALALRAEVLFGIGNLFQAAELAAEAARADPAVVTEDLAVPLARELRKFGKERAAGNDPLFELTVLRMAVDLGDAALDSIASAAQDPDPLVRGVAARLPALRASLLTDPSPYVRFMARSPDPDARANAWRLLVRTDVPLTSGTARIALPRIEGYHPHHLRFEVEEGELALESLRVVDEHGVGDSTRPPRDLPFGRSRLTCAVSERKVMRELELAFLARDGATARVSVWGDDTQPMQTRLFGAHGPDFETGLCVEFQARYPARLAFFERDFFRAVDRLLTRSDEHLVANGSNYGLAFGREQATGPIHAHVDAANRARVLPFHLEVTGPRPYDHLRGLSPSDTLPADDERLARRFAGDLRGHPARTGEAASPGAELHTRILAVVTPRAGLEVREPLDPLLELARVEYGPVGYRAIELFIERAAAEAARGPVGTPQGPVVRGYRKRNDPR